MDSEGVMMNTNVCEDKFNQTMRFDWVNEFALIVTHQAPALLSTQAQYWSLERRLASELMVALTILGMNNLYIRFQPIAFEQQNESDWVSWLQSIWQGLDPMEKEGRHIDIPTYYGGYHGPDLANVARYAGLSESALIEQHCDPIYTVFFMGFKPGFPYLGGLSNALSIPRREQVRQKVRAGSIGIGGEQTGIYPNDSPGGWHIIAWTPSVLFDLNRASPSLLRAGDTVRFVPKED
jgi:KipI family sensor histidine kinase inhibitor